LAARDHKRVEVVSSDCRIGAPRCYSSFEVGAVLVVDVGQTFRSDGNRSYVALFVNLHNDRRDRLAITISYD
jgi:hypothetical protein